jgi:hypothetical protein
MVRRSKKLTSMERTYNIGWKTKSPLKAGWGVGCADFVHL